MSKKFIDDPSDVIDILKLVGIAIILWLIWRFLNNPCLKNARSLWDLFECFFSGTGPGGDQPKENTGYTREELESARANTFCKNRGGVSIIVGSRNGAVANPFVTCKDGSCYDLNTGELCE